MKIVSMSYTNSAEFTDPVAWLQRINFYTGILEALTEKYQVESIEQISFEGLLERNGIKYHFLDLKIPKLPFPRRLHACVKKLQPGIIFINGLIFPLQVIQLRLKLGRNVKIILLHRGEKPFAGIKRVLQRLADTCIDAYLFSSAGFAKEWTKFGNIRESNKIHEVIQASSVFYPQQKTLAMSAVGINGSPVFLWVGRLDANKDPVTVVKAFIQFTAFQPGAKLYMVFQSAELLGEIKDLIQPGSGAEAAIKFVGRVQHAELQNWYNAADFIISGSHHEGSGIAVCEAMSCGCIPVLTDIISFRKMTGPGKCGLLYEPGSIPALLKCLLQTTTMETGTERQKTLEQFKAELSFEAISKKIERVIASLQPAL